MLRIFPLYYAVVTMCLVVLPHVHHAAALTFGKIDGSSIWYWLYFCNLSIARHNAFPHGPLSVCWSLAIEEQFYMVWPLLVLLLNRRQLIGACIGAGVVALASRLWLERAGAGWIPIYVLTPCRIDSLAAGALVAAMARGPGGLTGCLPTMKKGAIAFGMLLVVLLLVQQSGWLWRAPGRLVAYTLLAGLFASLLPLAISRPAASSVGKFLTSRPMRMLGRYSYAMYLFHVPCRDVAEVLMNPRHFPTILGTRLPGQMLFYVLALGLTIASAWASWTLFESPILRLKRFFPVDRKPARVPQRQIVRSGVGSTSRAPVQPHVDIDLAAEEALNCG